MADNDQEVDLKKPEDDKKEEPKPIVSDLSEEEQVAVSKGWKPKDQWEGPEDEWKPAKVFNEIGELKEKVSNSEKELKKTNKVIALMKEHHLKVRANAYKEAVEALKSERQKALKEQDFAKAEEIRDEIDDVKTKFTQQDILPKEVEAELRQVNQEPDPAFSDFVNRNPWYKPDGNEMSRKADAIGWAYKQSDPNLSFSEIIKKVEKDIKAMYPEKFNAPKNPVNEPGGRSGDKKNESKVKLTDEERAVARNFGMTDEQYAKELESYRGR